MIEELDLVVLTHDIENYNLKLGEIADIVRRTALDLPGGGVKSPTGEILPGDYEAEGFEFGRLLVLPSRDEEGVMIAQWEGCLISAVPRRCLLVDYGGGNRDWVLPPNAGYLRSIS